MIGFTESFPLDAGLSFCGVTEERLCRVGRKSWRRPLSLQRSGVLGLKRFGFIRCTYFFLFVVEDVVFAWTDRWFRLNGFSFTPFLTWACLRLV